MIAMNYKVNNMDLDDLKKELNQSLEQPIEIEAILDKIPTQKSHLLIYKMKRNIIIEIILYFLTLIWLVYESIYALSPALRIYCGTVSFLVLLVFPILYSLHKKIGSYIVQSFEIKDNLIELITLTKMYIRKYIIFTMVLLPICFMYSLVLSIIYASPESSFTPYISWYSVFLHVTYIADSGQTITGSIQNNVWMVIGILLLIIIILSVLNYIFTRAYLHFFYGRYIIQLESMLEELE